MPHASLTYPPCCRVRVKYPANNEYYSLALSSIFSHQNNLEHNCWLSRPGGQRWTGDSTSDVGQDTRGGPQCHIIVSLLLKVTRGSKEKRSAPVWRLAQVRLETGHSDLVWSMEASISVTQDPEEHHCDGVRMSFYQNSDWPQLHWTPWEASHPVINYRQDISLIWEKMSQSHIMWQCCRNSFCHTEQNNVSLKSPKTVFEANM